MDNDSLVVQYHRNYVNFKGDNVFISELLREGTTEYEAGYRFADRDGNCYTLTGASPRPEDYLAYENPRIIQNGYYINNNGNKVLLMNAEFDFNPESAYQRGFYLRDTAGTLYNDRGVSLDEDVAKRIIMSSDAYDEFLRDSGLKHLSFEGITLLEVIQMVSDAKLKLEVGKSYVNANSVVVEIVGAVAEDDPLYDAGHRFWDSFGVLYTADGKNGPDGSDLVRKYIKTKEMLLQEKHFYRNGLDDVVLILSLVEPNDPLFVQGFRLRDHRGTAYTPQGSVKSKLWGRLDLSEVVEPKDVTDEQMATIHEQSDAYIAALDRSEERAKTIASIKGSVRKMAPFIAGSFLGMGVAAAMAS